MEEQVEMVGRAFVDHYYLLFDSDRASLSSLYQPTSMLSFEGQKIFGADDISSKLNQLPFDQCKHLISTIDSQPSSITGGIVVFVSGSLQLPGEEHHLRFSQVIICTNSVDHTNNDTFTNSNLVAFTLKRCCTIVADVSLDSNSTRKLLCPEWYISPQLWLKFVQTLPLGFCNLLLKYHCSLRKSRNKYVLDLSVNFSWLPIRQKLDLNYQRKGIITPIAIVVFNPLNVLQIHENGNS